MDELKQKKQLIKRLENICNKSLYGSSIYNVIPIIVQLHREFGFIYASVIRSLVRSMEQHDKYFISSAYRELFMNELEPKLKSYLNILKRNRASGLDIKFDPETIRVRVSEAAVDALYEVKRRGHLFSRLS